MPDTKRKQRRTVGYEEYRVVGGKYDDLRLRVRVMSDGEHLIDAGAIFFPNGLWDYCIDHDAKTIAWFGADDDDDD